jgi:hypothetical protein
MSRSSMPTLVPGPVSTMFGRYPSLFTSRDNDSWKLWVDAADRGYQDLKTLLVSSSRLSIRARALFILLAPTQGWCPFYWNDGGSPSYLGQSADWAVNLPADLLSIYAEIVCVFCVSLRGYDPSTGLSIGGVGSLGGARDRLNNHLLALLDSDDQPTRQLLIFEMYQLLDSQVYCGMDEASGYGPFERLLWAPGVEEPWKSTADQKMAGIVDSELAGWSKPRAAHEEALGQYMYIVQSASFGEQLPYSVELFARQISYICALGDRAGEHNFDGWRMSNMLSLLSGPEYLSLRRQLIRFVLRPMKTEFLQFRVYNMGTMNAALTILAEFGQDPVLGPRLTEAIAAGQAHMDKVAAAADRVAQANLTALAGLA